MTNEWTSTDSSIEGPVGFVMQWPRRNCERGLHPANTFSCHENDTGINKLMASVPVKSCLGQHPFRNSKEVFFFSICGLGFSIMLLIMIFFSLIWLVPPWFFLLLALWGQDLRGDFDTTSTPTHSQFLACHGRPGRSVPLQLAVVRIHWRNRNSSAVPCCYQL